MEMDKDWKGLPLSEIHKMKRVPGSDSITQTLLEELQDDTLRMPFSEDNLQKDEEGESRQTWTLIEESMKKKISSGFELQKIILQFNPGVRWNFDGLKSMFGEEGHLSKLEADDFFDTILPGIQDLCLQLPQLLPSPVPLLRKQTNQSITLSQKQISALLAHAFFCTFPSQNASRPESKRVIMPYANFDGLFKSFSKQHHHEKLKCIFHYFKRRLSPEASNNLVTFARKSFSEFPDWKKSNTGLPRLHISAGSIEGNGDGLLQVDFANAKVGGGVLRRGCVQEEIRFLICPELIASRLFVEKLEDNECLIMSGYERYSNYRGYSSTFELTGNHEDPTPIDESNNHRKSLMVAINALKFKKSEEQFTENNIKRELHKAFVGFYPHESQDSEQPGVATGNWGCGAYRGDPRLKFLIQLMAAGEARQRDVSYFTFGDDDLRDTLYSTYQNLVAHQVTIGDLYSRILKYCDSGKFKEKDLFEYLRESFS